MEFIDTHNHILPGIDDGAPDVSTSIAMAEIAAADGISTIVATPHVIEGFFEGYDLDDRVALLQHELDTRKIAVKLVRGAEVPMSVCLSGNRSLLKSLAIGGRYILMESAETNFEQVCRAVYQVRLGGYIPVLAHPERTSYAQKNLDELENLVDHDEVFCQITVASLEGLFGSPVKKTCGAMARRGLVHLLASDAHSTRQRVPRLSDSYRELARLAGEARARAAVHDNPLRMIEGRQLRRFNREGSPARGSLLARILRRA